MACGLLKARRDSRRDIRAGAARWRRKGAGKGMTGGASRSDTEVMENAADARAQVAGRRGGRAGSGKRWLAGLVATLACGPSGRGAHGGHGAGRWAERNRPRTWLADARGRWAALELGCGCGPLLGQEKEKGRTGLGWWGWAAGPRARLRTGLPQRDEVGRRPGREERGNWARVGFGLGFQGCLG